MTMCDLDDDDDDEDEDEEDDDDDDDDDDDESHWRTTIRSILWFSDFLAGHCPPHG